MSNVYQPKRNELAQFFSNKANRSKDVAYLVVQKQKIIKGENKK